MVKQNPRPHKKPTLIILLLVIGCGALFHQVYEANAQLKPVLPILAAKENIQRWLQIDHSELLNKTPIQHLETLRSVYRNANHRLLWLQGYELSNTGEQLLQQLLESSADELFDYQYHLAYIQQRLYNLQTLPREAAALDILLTDAFIAYVSDVMAGRLLISNHNSAYQGLQPVSYQASVNKPTLQDKPIIDLLKKNHHPQKLARVLSNLAPQHPEYLRLREAFMRYQQHVSDDNWEPIPAGPSLKLGDQHPQIKLLRSQLIQHGDYQNSAHPTDRPSPIEEDVFDPQLDIALKNFQSRHGKKVDGIMGRETRALLNIPPNFRVRQIALNMKRWRELPRELGERYLWVNMTDYTLQLINNDKVELDMKVIIGKAYRKTPVMAKEINTLVLNPHWNVPRRIALYDILPQAKKDPNYLVERNFKVLKGWQDLKSVDINSIDWDKMNTRHFPYRLQQKPGRGNALGRIKFVIPNDMSIYLHDTSQPALFSKDERALSSGCVRVEKPFELAEALLKGHPDGEHRKLQTLLDQQNTQYLKLPKPVPTYLFYQTVWAGKDGTIHFRDDVYERDQVVHSRLTQTISL